MFFQKKICHAKKKKFGEPIGIQSLPRLVQSGITHKPFSTLSSAILGWNNSECQKEFFMSQKGLRYDLQSDRELKVDSNQIFKILNKIKKEFKFPYARKFKILWALIAHLSQTKIK